MKSAPTLSNRTARNSQTMEQRFSNNSLDLETLREFCRREGEAVIYRKGDQLEHEGM